MPTRHAFKALPSRSHIRVMILEPAIDPDSTLRFRFHEDLLSNLEGEYEAISYTWGTPDLTYPIHLVDDQRTAVFVTKNLDDGLRKIRHHADQRWLWADAVCINQIDNSEKGEQIGMMVDIFRGAKRVLAWLGLGGHGEEEVFQFLARLSRNPVATLNDFSVYSTFTKTLRKFLALPYFTRLWILQELVFNLDVVLLCGSIHFPFIRFCVAIDILKDNIGGAGLPTIDLPRDALRVRLPSLCKISQLWRRHAMFNREGTELHSMQDSLLELLVYFSDFACTDPRDRVYALHGMATDTSMFSGDARDSAKQLRVDYSLSILETYESLATSALLSGQAHKLLHSVCERQRSQDRPAGWPSWVPDWRLPPFRSSLGTSFAPSDIQCVDILEHAIILDVHRCIASLNDVSLSIHTKSHAFDPGSVTLEELCTALLEIYAQRGCQNSLHAPEDITTLVDRWIPVIWGRDEVLHLEARLRRFFHCARPDELVLGSSDEHLRQYDFRVRASLRGRCVFTTAGSAAGWIGIGASELEPEDRLIIGALDLSKESPYPAAKPKLAWIVRPTSNGDYRLVGDASVFLFQRSHLDDGANCGQCKCKLAVWGKAVGTHARRTYDAQHVYDRETDIPALFQEQGWEVGKLTLTLA